MLACDGPACLNARHENLASRGQHAIQDPRLANVEQDHRMQVAVAGVEQVGDRQVVALSDVDDASEDRR